MDKGAGRRRARYHSSMIDASLLQKGEDFEELPESYVIFITEHDVLGAGRALYRIGRYIFDTEERFDDGTHILYVNGAYQGEDAVGKLMHDFFCTDPKDMNYGVLADRVRFFKETKEGVATMCKAMEDMRNESFKEGQKDRCIKTAKKMLSDGVLSLEKIAEYSDLSVEEVRELRDGKTA